MRNCFLTWAVLTVVTAGAASAQTHTAIDIGGRSLDIVRLGRGNPPVIFEVGLADSLDTWIPVAQAISRFTTAIAYSRAGFGRSDPSPDGYSVRHEAADLHELLHRLGLRPPYVLVARSYGGIIARLYTSLYPSDVGGLVLVDATHEQQVERFGQLDSTYPGAFRAYYDSVLRTMGVTPEAAEIRETMRIQAAGAVDGLKPLPDLPIAVLTSMRSDPDASYVNGTARGHEVWRELHDEWFRRSRDGIHIETTRSGHDIQNTEPQLVISAIQFVLERVGSGHTVR
ncbi:MAG TPA: alpha/beta fold hydrolase [Gemmatimonadaceae bacterium]|nr:alpha/beta fold hydrolase [Gemmatimonadaceae bacterium]